MLQSDKLKLIVSHATHTGGCSLILALEPYLNYRRDYPHRPYPEPGWPIRYHRGGMHALPRRIEGYLHVCTIRNPWERLQSRYSRARYPHPYHFKPNTTKPFSDWVLGAGQDQLTWPASRYEPVDRWLRYEHLQEDFSALLEDLGVPPLELPWENQRVKPPEPWTAKGIDHVARVYAKDIALMGYEPPTPLTAT